MKKLSFIDWKNKLKKNYPDVNLISIEKINSRTILIVKTKYGYNKLFGSNINKCQELTIESSINKEDYFINWAKDIHNNYYSYENCKYTKHNEKVIITCPIHGDFEQEANSHLSLHGCSDCKNEKNSYNLKLDISDILLNYNIIDKSCYKNTKGKITVSTKYGNCKIGINILKNKNKISIKNAINKTEYCINQFKEVHGELYDYSLVEYINSKTDVTIICPKGHIFTQLPASHLNNYGCQLCSNELNGWTDSKWVEKGLKSKNFVAFQCYIIKCCNDTETFYKIGKTFTNIDKRLKNIKNYKTKIVQIINGDGFFISKLERLLQLENKEYRYIPKIKFGGWSECFSNINFEKI